jgi:uncharacterized membrane protein YeaQ/YmgE (transglycosylase-associated protein family)
MEFLIQLVLGAIGGNIGGAILKNLDLGIVGNSIAGIVGGGIGGQILNRVLPALGVASAGGMFGDVVSGCVGGVVVMAITGLIKNAVATHSHA